MSRDFPPPSSAPVRDYTLHGELVEMARELYDPDGNTPEDLAPVEMMVRPHHRYGAANPGEMVRVHRGELHRGPVNETLCTPEEYQELLTVRDRAREQLLAEHPEPTSDAIAFQIERAGKDAFKRAEAAKVRAERAEKAEKAAGRG